MMQLEVRAEFRNDIVKGEMGVKIAKKVDNIIYAHLPIFLYIIKEKDKKNALIKFAMSYQKIFKHILKIILCQFSVFLL